MARLTDAQLLELVYDCCVNSETQEEYKKKIKELSKKYHKEENYLKDLLVTHRSMLTEKEQQQLKEVQKKQKESVTKYKKYVESLLKMSEEELYEYIQTVYPSKIEGFFDGYIKKINNQELAEQAKKLFEKIKQIYLQQKEQQKVTRQQSIEEDSRKILEIITSRGYFDCTQFKREYSKEIGISEEELYKLYDRARKLIRKISPKEYEEYKRKLKENKIKTFIQKLPSIERMLELIPNKYDIIDYYINIQMEADIFIKLCEGFLTQEEKTKIVRFFSLYIDKFNYEIKPTWTKLTSNAIINNEILTVEEEEYLLEQMKKLKIPTNFFMLFLEKYRNGTIQLEKTKIRS